MNKNYLLGFFVLLLFACGDGISEKDFIYEKHGVYFVIPEDWSHEEVALEENGMYIMCEKEGEAVADTLKDESGQFIVSIIYGQVPLAEYMSMMREEMGKSLMYRSADMEMTEVKESVFNGNKGLSSTFTHESAGLKYRGELHTFYCGDNTIYIFVQESEEDYAKNKAGLAKLKKYFACRTQEERQNE